MTCYYSRNLCSLLWHFCKSSLLDHLPRNVSQWSPTLSPAEIWPSLCLNDRPAQDVMLQSFSPPLCLLKLLKAKAPPTKRKSMLHFSFSDGSLESRGLVCQPTCMCFGPLASMAYSIPGIIHVKYKEKMGCNVYKTKNMLIQGRPLWTLYPEQAVMLGSAVLWGQSDVANSSSHILAYWPKVYVNYLWMSTAE